MLKSTTNNPAGQSPLRYSRPASLCPRHRHSRKRNTTERSLSTFICPSREEEDMKRSRVQIKVNRGSGVQKSGGEKLGGKQAGRERERERIGQGGKESPRYQSNYSRRFYISVCLFFFWISIVVSSSLSLLSPSYRYPHRSQPVSDDDDENMRSMKMSLYIYISKKLFRSNLATYPWLC